MELVPSGNLAPVARAPRDLPVVVPQHVRDNYLPASARELIVKGIPANTLKAYAQAWKPFRLWCENWRRTYAPVNENTMVAYLDAWRALPVHNRCQVGRCGHRPSPSAMWVWYSAVRFYHGVGSPPLPWECGENLTRAMIGYSVEMVEAGWTPRHAPRAYPADVSAMVDALDLSNPKHLRDRAVILANFYTAARASDLGTYRIGDVRRVPKGIELTLRLSKTNRKRAGKVTEARTIFKNAEHPQYCGVTAINEWLKWLADRHDIRQGALFRPFGRWEKLKRGEPDALDFRMDGTGISNVIKDAAIRADLPNADDYTCHSLRRGRASQQRELGVDPLDIARAYGWVPGGAINVYLEEVERWAATAPGAVGQL